MISVGSERGQSPNGGGSSPAQAYLLHTPFARFARRGRGSARWGGEDCNHVCSPPGVLGSVPAGKSRWRADLIGVWGSAGPDAKFSFDGSDLQYLSNGTRFSR